MCCAWASAAHAQVQVERSVPPADLAALVALSSGVIVCEVVQVSPFAHPAVAPSPIPRREYTLRVLEIAKTDAHLPPVGGVIHLETMVEVGLEKPFERGDRLLLALQWHNYFSMYTIAYGPNGVMALRSDRVEPYGDSPLSISLKGRPVSDVVAQVRSAAAKLVPTEPRAGSRGLGGHDVTTNHQGPPPEDAPRSCVGPVPPWAPSLPNRSSPARGSPPRHKAGARRGARRAG
jgi:hypothetical protein